MTLPLSLIYYKQTTIIASFKKVDILFCLTHANEKHSLSTYHPLLLTNRETAFLHVCNAWFLTEINK